MRSVIETMDAPAPPPAKKTVPHDLGDGFGRLRQRVGHAADAVVDRVEDSVWTSRRAVRRGARKAEDVVYGTAGEIRRRPFSAVGTAFLAGAALASTVTFIALRTGRRAH